MKHAPASLKNIFFVLALAMLLPASAYAQKKSNIGKEFYVAFAENHGGQIYHNEDLNFLALYITSKVPTTGIVEVPALNFSQNFTSTPGTIQTIELPDGKQDNDPTVELTLANGQEETVVKGMAVHITANDDIAVYGINSKEYSTDAFMALPINVLGTEYRTMNYQSSVIDDYDFGGNDKFTPGEFWIVGVIDSTNITITPKAKTLIGQPAGMPFKVLLNKGDVYLVQGDLADNTNDLTGSLIESDQSIAVLSGHVRCEIPHNYRNQDTKTPSRNHIVEQMPPVSAWGDSALVVRYASALLPDLVRVVSSEDNNKITVNGTLVATLNAGGFYEITSLPGPTSIQGTSPIMVGQFLHTDEYSVFPPPGKPTRGDPAYALVFPVEQFDTSYTFIEAQRDLFTFNYVNVVADPTGIAGITITGTYQGKAISGPVTGPPLNAVFFPIPGSNYQYAQIGLDQGTYNISGPKPFGITVYGLGPADAYAYTGGSLLKTITPFKTVDLVIDFGDRVMTGPPPYITTGPVGKNKWDTTVYLQNISSDPYTITGFTSQGGNGFNDFNVTRFPASIAPSAYDSITIEFTTDQPYVEMNTTLKALTPHLEAYVVQVKGRGILVNAEMYSDSNTTIPIDTLDFGVFDAAVDPPKDSFVYVANKGTTDLTIDADNIAGPNPPPIFSIQPPRTIKSLPVIPPYILHPFNLLSLEDSSAKIPLRFTPTGLANGFYQAEYDISTNGQQRKVILLAEVKTILKSSVTSIAFDTAFLCEQETRSIFVNNPNDFPITVTGVNLGGMDSLDFSLITGIPLVIPPNSQSEIKLTFSPNDTTGMRTGTVTLSFDLPKGFTQTLALSAYGDQLSSSFWARNNIHILPNEQTLFPIYARSPMQEFASTSLRLTLSYDPTHLLDDPSGFVQTNTLTALGEWDINNDSLGYSIYSYHTLDGSIITGGSDTEVMPIIYILFRSNLNPGDNPISFHQDIAINYTIEYDNSSIPSGCILSLAPAGRITLDSSCETVYLLHDTLLFPMQSYIEPINPNPIFNGRAKFVFDVPQDDVVRLDVIDMLGNQAADILDEARKPGEYQLEWNASGLKQGIYYVRLRTAGQICVRKIVVIK